MLYFRKDNNGAMNLDGLVEIRKGTVVNEDNHSDIKYYENSFGFINGWTYNITYDSVEARDEEYEQIRHKLIYNNQAY